MVVYAFYNDWGDMNSSDAYMIACLALFATGNMLQGFIALGFSLLVGFSEYTKGKK